MHINDEVVAVGGVRSAIGKFGGSLKGVAPTERGTTVLREVLARTGGFGEEVGHVVFGVLEMYGATVDEIKFDFPDGHPAMRLAPIEPVQTPSLLYGDVTFTYSMGRQIKNYL